MARLIDSDLTQTHPTRGTLVDLSATMHAVVAELEIVLRQREVEVVLDRGEPLPPVAGDRDELYRVLTNVMVNAADSMPAGGLIHVRARRTRLQSPSVSAVQIEIADTGLGIAAELVPRVFEEGFTTKHASHGRGLGLAICQEIVRAHGGGIELSSEQGKGTTVRVVLPVAASEA
jgi:signal transduction histidine kinase